MNKHPYLRAYMAGIMVPTPFLLVVIAGFCIARYVINISIPIERVIMFPMAVVPNLWGLWNVLYLALRSHLKISLGAHGAILPFILAPSAYLVARILDFQIPHIIHYGFPIGFPVAIALYYLVWKHLVGFLNAVLSIA